MDGYKDFQGKTLDEAIREACSYFDAPREKLEIDIIQDAKSGIFGLVGVRKAKIRARRVQLKTTVEELVGRGREAASPAEASEGEGKARSSRRPAKPVREKRETASEDASKASSADGDDAAPSRQPRGERGRSDRQPREARAPKSEAAVAESDAGAAATEQSEAMDGEQRERTGRRRRRGGRGRGRSQNGERAAQEATGTAEAEAQGTADAAPAQEPATPAPRGRGQNRPAPARRSAPPAASSVAASAEGFEDFADGGDDATPEGLPDIPLADLDQELVRSVALEVTGKLVAPIIGEAALTVDLADGRIKVTVDCGDNSGLLIGREGQTLASIQYLASRIVARKLNAAVRVQLDTGDYRERQDEKLRELAVSLAEKARATGKPQSTRPLSSYHRRVVHLALQEEEDIVTRSKGDGPLKRVIVLKRRKSPAA